MAEKLTTLAKRLRPFINGQVGAIATTGAFMQEGPGIDLVGNKIGLGGDTILLFNVNRDPVEEFPATGAGLTAALAAAVSGDLIQLPTGSISMTAGVTVGDGVTLRGSGGNEGSTLQSVGDIGAALITVVGAAQMEVVRVNYTTANNAADRIAINQTGANSSVRRCNAYCTNAGGGASYGHVVAPSSGFGYVSFGSAIADNTGGGKSAGYAALTNANLRSCFGVAYDGTPSIGLQARGAVLRQCDMQGETYGCYVYSSGGAQTTRIIDGDCNGVTKDFFIADANATAEVYALQYDTITNNGTLTYLFGDRAAYSVEDYHANDIEANVLTRHLPLPGDDGEVPVSQGGEWTLGTAGGAIVATTNVSNPPTAAQLITAFGPADTFANAGKIGVLNDNSAGLNEYAVFSDGGQYWYLPLAKASGTTASFTVDSTATIAGTTRWFGRATMERLADDTWVLVYEEGSVHYVNDDVVHIRFSDDQGVTWTAEDTDLDGNPVTGFPAYPTGAAPADVYGPGDTYIWQAPNGDLWLHTWKVDYDGDLMDGCWHMKSTDNGKTWGTWSKIDYSGLDAATDSLTMITEQHFIIGSTIYMAGRIHQDATEAVVKNAFFTSTDNGATWTYVSDMSSFVNNTVEVAMEYLGGNNILAYFRATANDKSYKATSSDLGATWSALTDVTATLNTIGRNRLYTRAHLKGYADWWTDSVLIMVGFVFTSPGDATPRRNAVWVSQDQGATWVGPTYVAAQDEDGGYGDALWNTVTNKLINISYKGLYTNADIQQYTITVNGV